MCLSTVLYVEQSKYSSFIIPVTCSTNESNPGYTSGTRHVVRGCTSKIQKTLRGHTCCSSQSHSRLLLTAKSDPSHCVFTIFSEVSTSVNKQILIVFAFSYMTLKLRQHVLILVKLIFLKLILWFSNKTEPWFCTARSCPSSLLSPSNLSPFSIPFLCSAHRHKITTLRPTYQNHLKSRWSTPHCWLVSVSQCSEVSWKSAPHG